VLTLVGALWGASTVSKVRVVSAGDGIVRVEGLPSTMASSGRPTWRSTKLRMTSRHAAVLSSPARRTS